MGSNNEWAVEEDDLKGGGGFSAKPRAKYVGTISKAEVKTDKNKKRYLKFGVKIAAGKFKNGLAFENYLVLNRDGVNAYQAARRNSFYKAIMLSAGSLPPGVPGGPDVEILNDALVGFNLEWEFQNVPGEDYSITTSKSKKSAWVTDGWEDKLNDKGQLVKDGSGNIIRNEDGEPAPIDPREVITFYELDDEFNGLAAPAAADAVDDEEWG